MPHPILFAVVLLPAAAGALAAGQTAGSPYARWLNEDVVYIIEPREKAAFEALGSDPEREQFIEQFWLRRDPTPGTSDNEYKVEHYRRIAYANQRFAWSGAPGWKTDRGRIYIVYGPPDEIESHPSGGAGLASPWEDWRYRHIEGLGGDVVFKFVDRRRTGDFLLVSGPGAPGRT